MSPTIDPIVLFGGDSGERRVSVASAQHIVEVLGACAPWFLAPDGRVYLCPREALARFERPFETDFAPPSHATHATLASALESARGSDAVFVLALHGGSGEDGSLQRDLESRGLAFTGSGSAASARAFDKRAAREIAQARGIATADAVQLPRGDEAGCRDALGGLFTRAGRAVVKPVADGSSVGLHHVRERADVALVAAVAASSAVQYFAEAFVAGTELTVGVVDDARGPRALPASEVRLAPGRAFDFEGKYLGRGTVEITPAEVPEPVSTAARALAVAMHTALGCEGYTRTDVIVGPQGPVFLETNTLPGLTRASFLPQQLVADGTTVRGFLDAQIALARRRRESAR